jgi:hypothetical protein
MGGLRSYSLNLTMSQVSVSTIPSAYAEGWSGRLILPIDEATARKRHRPGAEGVYAVALGDPVKVVGQVNRELHFVGVIFPDRLMRPSIDFSFYGKGERLFLRHIAEWQYAGDSEADRKATVGRDRTFGEDGSLRIATYNLVRKENLFETAQEPVDISTHWEPSPEFGDWASITRPDRDKPLDQQPQWHRQLFTTTTTTNG